jgi:hypothetical protein
LVNAVLKNLQEIALLETNSILHDSYKDFFVKKIEHIYQNAGASISKFLLIVVVSNAKTHCKTGYLMQHILTSENDAGIVEIAAASLAD